MKEVCHFSVLVVELSVCQASVPKAKDKGVLGTFHKVGSVIFSKILRSEKINISVT